MMDKISNLLRDGHIKIMCMIHRKDSERVLFAIAEVYRDDSGNIVSVSLVNVLTRESIEVGLDELDSDFVLLNPLSSSIGVVVSSLVVRLDYLEGLYNKLSGNS